MAEYTANALQTVNPGESVIFTDSPVPCRRGLVRHRDGTGNFLLAGYVPFSGCCFGRNSALYFVDFGANIAIPSGGTVDPISVALTIDGATIPASKMIVTPAAVEELFNISRAISAEIWRGCCETVTVMNTSDQPINIQNASIDIDRPDLNLTR